MNCRGGRPAAPTIVILDGGDMRVLVIGSGGREHTIAWSLRRSRHVREVICAPGNGGIERDARCVPVSLADPSAVAGLALAERVDFVVVGPEAPLASGLVDHLQAKGIPALGPKRDAARLESSKVFAKEFMQRHGIPTACCTIHSDPQEALSRLASREISYPLVVKADGLAAGKGVIVARTPSEAEQAIRRIMIEREFGPSGDRLILEDFLEGVEASFIVFTDGDTILPAVAARDHKAVYDHDAGPNTGGMGAYSADGLLNPRVEKMVLDEIIRPVVAGMKSEGTPFQGILYAGLMLARDGPRVLEFNVRMGDPEAQAILPRLESDFASLCEAVCRGRLSRISGSLVPVRCGLCNTGFRRIPGAVSKGQGHFGPGYGGRGQAHQGVSLRHQARGAESRDRRRTSSWRDRPCRQSAGGGDGRVRSCKQNPFWRDALSP